MDPYSFVGEIKALPYEDEPENWVLCDGRELSAQTYSALFSIIGKTYGWGSNDDSFRVPNLVNRAVIGQGNGPGIRNIGLGEAIGESQVTLFSNQLPQHSHAWKISEEPGETSDPHNMLLTNVQGAIDFKKPPVPLEKLQRLNKRTISSTFESQPHDNIQPCLALCYYICVEGEYPSWN
ncbi:MULTISPECIES: phage tail protein [Gammaproteobacteria]|uniref:phage tail protein n=1 Tax=Gammaproteobacteria TaxID=1236 RepID=UPI000DD0600A|nr:MULTISPECIES: tail fiber protein [Gammaproteobacteria]RTE86081.1 hypothetical protein DQX04_05785 [Aliidiomarina sp. B3213]TCZ91435.1 hypothetical protein EYQ95_05795 [Lysobacter sp. N42]